ncbi:zinc metalloproteinase Mpr protein (plasmid) [Collimonas arenae]|uniref:Zinc metalloproteinase Mpr protein n=1 Tax=Collimonas arenae TaxID=279058 RepID=A0A0A1FKM2_9BURK|nr:SprT-like domain-containing protein [Collimonas arenae]AIY44229.1 zinc metalloproteinase Mpr protein [Collimonas arenae]
MLNELQEPTEEIYTELRKAYKFFNERLFDNQLPGCMFTLQRKQNTFGFYSKSRFVRRDASGKADEIALNPAFFAFRSVEKTLSTLVHEMVHQWQKNFGKPTRSGYHNKEWAAKMESVGLMPSHTGEPGGRRVGQQMTHYIIDAGPFQTVCAAPELAVMISWVDVAAKKVPASLTAVQAQGEGGDDPPNLAALTELGLSTVEPGTEKKVKIKYTCPACEVNVWGKPELHIRCGDCDVEFVDKPKKTEKD